LDHAKSVGSVDNHTFDTWKKASACAGFAGAGCSETRARLRKRHETSYLKKGERLRAPIMRIIRIATHEGVTAEFTQMRKKKGRLRQGFFARSACTL
jgi:hypothetical protein